MARKTSTKHYVQVNAIADKLRDSDFLSVDDWAALDLLFAAFIQDPCFPRAKLAQRVGERLKWDVDRQTDNHLNTYMMELTDKVRKALGPQETRELFVIADERVALTPLAKMVHSVANKGLMLKFLMVGKIPPEDWEICHAVLTHVLREPKAPFDEIARNLPEELKSIYRMDGRDDLSKWLAGFETKVKELRGLKEDAARKADGAESARRKKDGGEFIRRGPHGNDGLTSLGKKMRKLAARYVQIMEICKELHGPVQDEPLRIAASEGVSNFLLPHVIGAFTARNDQWPIPRTDQFHLNDFLDRMFNDEVHLAIAWGGYNPDFLARAKDDRDDADFVGCWKLRRDHPWLEVRCLKNSLTPVYAIFSSHHDLADELARNRNLPDDGGIAAEDDSISADLLERHAIYYPQFYQLEQIARELTGKHNRREVIALPEVINHVRLRQGVGLFPGWPWELARLHRDGIRAARIQPKAGADPHLYTMRLLAFLPRANTGQVHPLANFFCDAAEKTLERLNVKRNWSLTTFPKNLIADSDQKQWHVHFITTGPNKNRPVRKWRYGTLDFHPNGHTTGEAALTIERTRKEDGVRVFGMRKILDDDNRLTFEGSGQDEHGNRLWSHACFSARLTKKDLNMNVLFGVVCFNQPEQQKTSNEPAPPTSALIVLSSERLLPGQLEQIQQSNLAFFLSHGDTM